MRSKAAPPNERRPLFSCGSVRRGLSCNKPKVGLYFGVFEDTVAAVVVVMGRGGTYAALRSGRLAVQLFEMREQAAEVIKDFSRGRLAAECGATEAREAKQQLKKKEEAQ